MIRFLYLVAFLSINVTAGDLDSNIRVDIKWTGGEGQKAMSVCPDGYFASSVSNMDWGGHDQSVLYMMCQRMSDYLPGVNTAFSNCEIRSVAWWPKEGDKEFSSCPQGKFATGFSNFDHGNHDQSVNQIYCCGVTDSVTQDNTFTVQVPWWGDEGEKPAGDCPPGYYITSIKNKDYGDHDQAVSEIQCSQPQ